MVSDKLRDNKRRESPISVSGEGFVFEHSVQAFFILQMMGGGFVPRMDGCEITKVTLQSGRYGRNTDDCEVTLKERKTGEEKKLFIQIKRSFNLQPSNKAFTQTVKDAWNDFIDPNFKKLHYRIALVTGELDTNGSGLKNILTHIQSSYRQADHF